ncbi:major capsid family protein [Commensalibacter communis]|uniref:major capsid family protein n=1 Tax=Commensalibacter communis TaxID=2972786 RepID=UPI0022FFBCC4|nr:major capsid family protein [Commensalibacter communis]CAI3933514.1 DUF2184 domain [Commensalibacter communis]CAI3944691.1 DUF2184 domain [Commensalibacter communis]
MSIQTTTWARDREVLQSEFGIHLPTVLGYTSEVRANDAAIFTPVTTANIGVPSQFTTYLDPRIIEILTAPLMAAEIYGEGQRGTWVDDTMEFVVLENVGEVAQYGDFNKSGRADVNTNFPQRQQFIVQTFLEVGDREQARAERINVDLASKKRIAAVETLNEWQNQSYFFGVKNLKNYGTLNDPNLSPPIAPKTKSSGSVGWEKATALEIYEDIQQLYNELQSRNKGIVNLNNAVRTDARLKLVIPNSIQGYLLKTNEYGLTVLDNLKKNYPNLIQTSAPQLELESGNLVQLFVENYQGIDTFTCMFSEKLRSHGIFRESSSISEKLTQGSWGSILTRPTLVAQMIGV